MGGDAKPIRSRKWQITASIAVLVLAAGIFLPRWLLKIQVYKMDLEKVERVEYVEYEGDPFCSAIKVKKMATRGDNREIIDNLIGAISTANKKEKAMDSSNKILFFYYGDEEVFNAYINDDFIGLNYGKSWLRVRELDNIIDEMYFVDLLKHKGSFGRK